MLLRRSSTVCCVARSLSKIAQNVIGSRAYHHLTVAQLYSRVWVEAKQIRCPVAGQPHVARRVLAHYK